MPDEIIEGGAPSAEDTAALLTSIGIGADADVETAEGVSDPGEAVAAAAPVEPPAAAAPAPEPETAAAPDPEALPAQANKQQLARTAYHKRLAAKQDIQDRLDVRTAELEASKKSAEFATGVVEALKQLKSAPPVPQETAKPFLEDPEGQFTSAVDGFTADNKALATRVQELEAAAAARVAQDATAYQQQVDAHNRLGEMRQDAASWEEENPGFITGERQIFAGWQQAVHNDLARQGVPANMIPGQIESRITGFWDRSKITGQHPCAHLEAEAALYGVNDAQPGNGAVQGGPPVAGVLPVAGATSAGQQALASSAAAAAAGMDGSIGDGASGPPVEKTPSTEAELEAAGVDPGEWVMAQLERTGGDRSALFETLSRLETGEAV